MQKSLLYIIVVSVVLSVLAPSILAAPNPTDIDGNMPDGSGIMPAQHDRTAAAPPKVMVSSVGEDVLMVKSGKSFRVEGVVSGLKGGEYHIVWVDPEGNEDTEIKQSKETFRSKKFKIKLDDDEKFRKVTVKAKIIPKKTGFQAGMVTWTVYVARKIDKKNNRFFVEERSTKIGVAGEGKLRDYSAEKHYNPYSKELQYDYYKKGNIFTGTKKVTDPLWHASIKYMTFPPPNIEVTAPKIDIPVPKPEPFDPPKSEPLDIPPLTFTGDDSLIERQLSLRAVIGMGGETHEIIEGKSDHFEIDPGQPFSVKLGVGSEYRNHYCVIKRAKNANHLVSKSNGGPCISEYVSCDDSPQLNCMPHKGITGHTIEMWLLRYKGEDYTEKMASARFWVKVKGLPGDIDSDGKLTATDHTIMQAFLKDDTIDFAQIPNSDADGDGDIDEDDLKHIESNYYGDVNGDGKVTEDDSQAVADYAFGGQELDEQSLKRSDTNSDGIVDIRDLVAITQVVDVDDDSELQPEEQPPPEQVFEKGSGDLNHDLELTDKDLEIMIGFVFHGHTLSEDNIKTANMNGDANPDGTPIVDNMDITILSDELIKKNKKEEMRQLQEEADSQRQAQSGETVTINIGGTNVDFSKCKTCEEVDADEQDSRKNIQPLLSMDDSKQFKKILCGKDLDKYTVDTETFMNLFDEIARLKKDFNQTLDQDTAEDIVSQMEAAEETATNNYYDAVAIAETYLCNYQEASDSTVIVQYPGSYQAKRVRAEISVSQVQNAFQGAQDPGKTSDEEESDPSSNTFEYNGEQVTVTKGATFDKVDGDEQSFRKALDPLNNEEDLDVCKHIMGDQVFSTLTNTIEALEKDQESLESIESELSQYDDIVGYIRDKDAKGLASVDSTRKETFKLELRSKNQHLEWIKEGNNKIRKILLNYLGQEIQ